MPTRAAQILAHRGSPFEIIRYHHTQKGADFASRATGFALAKIIKTLVVGIGGGRYVLALVPGNCRLDVKRLALALAVKRAALADASTAQRMSGYLVGGISPFGTAHKMDAVMEAQLLSADQVLINAGRRGIMLKMAPADIVTALQCRVLSIIQPHRGV